MRVTRLLRVLVCFLVALTANLALPESPPIPSKKFFVDPVAGNDANSGNTSERPWRTLTRLNRQALGPGDEVFIEPGLLAGSLAPNAQGSKARPVLIRFLPGRHEFRARGAVTLAFFVSNSADAPREPRPIGILVKNDKHLKIIGSKGSELWYGDRMTELMTDRSEDITYEGLTIDMVRPTVSEFRVLESDAKQAVIQIAQGSTYQIENGRFRWTGDLGRGSLMAQEGNLSTGQCLRRGNWDPFELASAEPLSGNRVLLKFPAGNPGLTKGRQTPNSGTCFETRRAQRTLDAWTWCFGTADFTLCPAWGSSASSPRT